MMSLVTVDLVARDMLYAALGVWTVAEIAGSLTKRGDRSRDRDTGRWFILTLVAGLVAAFFIVGRMTVATIPGGWVPVGLGAALVLTGVVLRQWAIHRLGRFFTRSVMIHAEHRVITDGPYRLLRHPSYTGYLLTLLGLGLMLANWLSLLLVVGVPLVGVLYRIRVEERVLLTELGQPYAEFCCGRHRLVPGVW
jgi:protein-S-isoprenylcysteine O-methyltransferase Ste14